MGRSKFGAQKTTRVTRELGAFWYSETAPEAAFRLHHRSVMNDKIRYGVVGLGYIAQVAVLPAFRHAWKNSELTALVTGDPLKAKKLSRRYSVPHVYGYEELDHLIQSDIVDALYICVPNHRHTEITTRALRSGIHVLCEKPLALTVDDAEEMRSAMKDSRAKLMTAYRLHFEAANLRVLDLCKSGKLGKLKYFGSNFSFEIKDKNNIRLKAETGGGPLWDIGIYCINAARNIFNAEPIEVFGMATASSDPRFDEVHETVSAVMKFPGERTGSFNCSFGANDISEYRVVGDKGSVFLENAYDYATKRTLHTQVEDKKRKQVYKKADQFAPEIVYFSECILSNKNPEPSLWEGWADMRVILALQQSIREERPVRLDMANVKHLRPNSDMQMYYPGVSEPKVIHAKSPSG